MYLISLTHFLQTVFLHSDVVGFISGAISDLAAFRPCAAHTIRHHVPFLVAGRISSISENCTAVLPVDPPTFRFFQTVPSTAISILQPASELWYDSVISVPLFNLQSDGTCILFLLRRILRTYSYSLHEDSSNRPFDPIPRISISSSFSPMLVREHSALMPTICHVS